jgi:hypothetical protein
LKGEVFQVKAGRKSPDVVMWRGVGILSPKHLVLETWADGDYALAKFEAYHPRGARLVLVTARLERVTKKQICDESRHREEET